MYVENGEGVVSRRSGFYKNIKRIYDTIRQTPAVHAECIV